MSSTQWCHLLRDVPVPVWVLTGISCAIGFVRYRQSRSWGFYEAVKDLSGEVFVVTGASSGLGKEVARVLCRQGAKVVMGVRDLTKAKQVIREITDGSSRALIDAVHLDLSSLSSVSDFAQEISTKYDKIDGLVLNAGVWVPMNRHKKTSDGYEIHFGVNYLGHFLLTELLLQTSLLRNASRPRVINVSSSLMKSGKIKLDSPDEFVVHGRQGDGLSYAPNGYLDSKLCGYLYMAHLKSTLSERGLPDVHCYSVCPGWCYSGLAREEFSQRSLFRRILDQAKLLPLVAMFMRSSYRGAMNITRACVEDEQSEDNFVLYKDCMPTKYLPNASASAEDAKRLYDLSIKLVQNYGVARE